MRVTKKNRRPLLWAAASSLLVTLVACHGHSSNTSATAETTDYASVAIPEFNADSAWQYTADQLAFGPRTPGSQGQTRCAEYLARQMRRWCDTVIVQEFTTTLWDGRTVKGKNIISTLHPATQEGTAPHILLAAHWDSRLWADHDPDSANHKRPIPGANDGASGVATLMEMARVMSQMRPTAAIDFVFFDLEDQGIPEWAEVYQDHTWCLGSQHWSKTPHLPYYTARFGILFDMVGTDAPRYTKEECSMRYASTIMDKMWTAAAILGHQNIFQNQRTDMIMDDHYYINSLANIPTIDIVQNTPGCSFYPYWHTVKDDLDAVNRQSLKIVADVTMKTIYADYGAKR